MKNDATKLVDNVGDAEQVAKGTSKASLLERRLLDRWELLLATSDGRAVIWQIIEECGAFQSGMGRNDAETNYKVGKQDIGHFILAWLHRARPDALVEMMLENAKERS